MYNYMLMYMYKKVIMRIASIASLRSQLAKLLDFVQKGETIEVQRRNVTIAKLVPVRNARGNETKLGAGKNSAKIIGDILEPGIPLSDWEMLR